jgi:chromosome partitioning protein
MPTIAVVNQKGGVGKTTVALGVASAAVHRGSRVAVVDLDPQANATTGLAVWDAHATVDKALEADRPGSVAEILTTSGWPPEVGHPPDVAASSPYLAQREPQLANDPVGAQDRLQVALAGLDHDLVIIDCPPSLGLLTVNGLFAADAALIVTEPAAWASDGVEQILLTVSRIAARKPGGLAVAGIAVNRLGRTRDARYWHEQLIETYGDLVFPPVHLRAAVAEAAAQSLPIHGLGHRAGAAEAAAEFDAVLERIVPSPVVAPATTAPPSPTPSWAPTAPAPPTESDPPVAPSGLRPEPDLSLTPSVPRPLTPLPGSPAPAVVPVGVEHTRGV